MAQVTKEWRKLLMVRLGNNIERALVHEVEGLEWKPAWMGHADARTMLADYDLRVRFLAGEAGDEWQIWSRVGGDRPMFDSADWRYERGQGVR